MNPNPQQIILALSAQLTNAMIERDEAYMKIAELEQTLEKQVPENASDPDTISKRSAIKGG